MDRRLITSRVGALPILPRVVREILDMSSRPDVTAGELYEVMLLDPALSAGVLQMANSALFDSREPLEDLQDVVYIAGPGMLRSLVLASTTRFLYRRCGPRLKELPMWEHAIAAALSARLIRRRSGDGDSEDAFVGGLVHDIGKVVLDQNLGDDYQPVLERVQTERITFQRAENEILGFDHAEVGGLVARSWGLSEPVEEAVRLHHRPREAEIDSSLCATVSLANQLCMKLEIGPEPRPDLDLEALDAAVMLDLGEGSLAWVTEELQRRLQQGTGMFGVDPPAPIPRGPEPSPPR